MLEQCKISGFADEINKDFQVQLNVLTEIGQKYIEFRSADEFGIADFTLEMAASYQNDLEKRGISVSSIGSPIGKISIVDDFAPHYKQFQHIVELAGIFHVSYIRMFSFYIPEGHKPEAYREEVFRRLQAMIDYAKEHSVILLHENEKEIYGDTKERCKELMDRFYGDSFQCVFDFANFVQCQVDTIAAFELLRPFISYIHIKDALKKDGKVVLPGNGDGNVKKILSELDHMGYDGFLSLEPHLVSFSGLEKLEQSLQKKTEEDGIAAYKQAYYKLKDILLLS